MAAKPILVMEDIQTAPRRDLFTLLGVRWTATPFAWVGVVAEVIFGIAAAVFTGGSLVLGVVWGVLVVATLSLHSIGHILGGISVGAPMNENLITASRHVNIYRNDPPNLPSRIHLGRALGGPVMNLTVGLIALVLYGITGSKTLLFFGGLNALIGIGALAPVPSVDGEVIWRELRR